MNMCFPWSLYCQNGLPFKVFLKTILLGYLTVYFWLILTTIRDYIPPLPSWALRLNLTCESQSCILKLNTFISNKPSAGGSWKCPEWSASFDWRRVFQDPPGGARKVTESTWGSCHAIQKVAEGWLRPPTARGETFHSVFGKTNYSHLV